MLRYVCLSIYSNLLPVTGLAQPLPPAHKHLHILQEQLNLNLSSAKCSRALFLRRGYLKRHDVGIGAVLVDLIHCALQSDCLLSQVFQVLGALFGLFMVFSKLRGKGKKAQYKSRQAPNQVALPALLPPCPHP